IPHIVVIRTVSKCTRARCWLASSSPPSGSAPMSSNRTDARARPIAAKGRRAHHVAAAEHPSSRESATLPPAQRKPEDISIRRYCWTSPCDPVEDRRHVNPRALHALLRIAVPRRQPTCAGLHGRERTTWRLAHPPAPARRAASSPPRPLSTPGPPCAC